MLHLQVRTFEEFSDLKRHARFVLVRPGEKSQILVKSEDIKIDPNTLVQEITQKESNHDKS